MPFPTSLSSRIAGWSSAASRRIGFAPRPGQHSIGQASWLLTRTVARQRLGQRHLEDEYLDLVGADTVACTVRTSLPIPGHSVERATALLAPLDGARFLVVSPGARYGPAKRWPVSRFATAARAISKVLRGTGIVVVGEAADLEVGRELSERLGPNVINLVGKTDLPTLSSLLASSAGVLSNDSGTAHLAAAVGATTAVLFGSTDPAWTAPRGDRVTVIHHKVRCSPCFRRQCPLIDAYACLRILEARTVTDSFAALCGCEAA